MKNASHPWIGGFIGARARDYGGKAAGLGQLVEHRMQVPQGFCIHVDAFFYALNETIGGTNALDILQHELRSVQLPQAFIQCIQRHVDAYPADTRWAVRSSSVEEDAASASLAGQGLTCLNVEGVDVLKSVRAVWASHFDAQALMYRQQTRQPLLGGGMGVVIQQMVDAQSAGVVFSEDPAQPESSHSVISVAQGSGVHVVDGHAQQTYHVDVRSGELEGDFTSDDIISKTVLLAVYALGQRCAHLFGGARDVEWAVDDEGMLWVLQQRPLSVVLAGEASWSVWSNANVGEALPGVGTPLTWSVIKRFSEKGFERAFRTMGLRVPDDLVLVQGFRGRVYLNLSAFMQVASAIPLLSPQTLSSLAGGGGGRSVEGSYTPSSPWAFLSRLPLTIPRVAFNQLSMPVVARLWSMAFDRVKAVFDAQDLLECERERLRQIGDALDRFFDLNGLIMLTCSSNFLMSYVIMKQTLALCADDSAPQDLSVMGNLDVRSAEPGIELLPIAHAIRQTPAWHALFSEHDIEHIKAVLERKPVESVFVPLVQMLDHFVATHGYRAPKEAELATPRWREDLSFVLGVLKGFSQATSIMSVEDLNAARVRQLELSRQAILEALPGVVSAPFEVLLALTRSNAKRREALRARVVESLDMYRRYFLACGHHMVKQGVLCDPADVFFLSDVEVRQWMDSEDAAAPLQALVLCRRCVHEDLEGLSDPPQTFILKGRQMIDEATFLNEEPLVRTSKDSTTYQGIPGGGGPVEGIVRIARTPSDAVELTPNTILVVPQADVGWTPLFLQIGGIIMELGGPLSHACIVAREYGVTSVVNVPGILNDLKDGMHVRIDGQTGEVCVSHET